MLRTTTFSTSGREVFLSFSLPNVLRATTACNFSSLIWPDGSAPTALASLLFDPLEPQIIGKHGESRLFYPFARLHLISSDSFSSLIFSLLLFLTLPTSAFPSLHIVRSLTSKFPSIKMCIYIYTYIFTILNYTENSYNIYKTYIYI